MKKVISIMISVVMLITMTIGIGVTAQAATGSGTYDDPYVITNNSTTSITFSPTSDSLRCAVFTAPESDFYEFALSNITDGGVAIYSDSAFSSHIVENDVDTGTAKVAWKLTKGQKYGIALLNQPTKSVTSNLTVKKHTEHKFIYDLKPATTTENGYEATYCNICYHLKAGTTEKTLYKIKSVTLSKTSYTYDGKVKKPTVTVKDSKGNKISSSNYTVTYAKGRKNVGKYTVTVKFKNRYKGTVKKTFTIKPKATSISSVAAKSKGFTVKWKKLTTQTTGYQIQYSTSSKFSSAKTVTVSKNKTTSKTITKLKAKKKYYVRVRTYKTVNGTKYYSSWSKAKTVTTKK